MLVTNYNGLGYDFLFEKLFLSLKIKRTMNQKNKNKNKENHPYQSSLSMVPNL